MLGLAALLFPSCGQAQQSGPLEHTSWVVERPPKRLSTFYADRVPPFLGETVYLGRDSMSLFYSSGDNNPTADRPTICNAPDYRFEVRTREQFYRYESLPLDELLTATPDSLRILSVYCPQAKTGAEFYLLDDDRILLSYLGLYCFLRPARKWLWPWEWFD